ncbi:N-6 DNA methylase [Nocardioides sp. BGMRC 2183]|nr:N-6 DNA methylase [Nocardioides sp. BGMRC 2183]
MSAGAEGAEAIAAAYEAGLRSEGEDRRARGAFYTPPALVDWVLDRALAGEPRRVLDPACGTGHLLVAAARRLGDVRAVWGSDLDPEAVRIARLRLAELDPTVPADEIAARVRVADGLEEWTGATFDAVVGNPPFLGQLRRRTAGRTGGIAAYTDTSAAFLHVALGLAAPGGVVALVQPLSVLAARDAGPVRTAVADVGAITDLWCSPTPVFADTTVLTCVPVVRIGATPATDPDAWGALAAPAFGTPVVTLPARHGRLRDLADVTADFRDQYYGLRPYVAEIPEDLERERWAPLVTTGLIDPAELRWGHAPTRFARRRYAAPAVDLTALAAGPDRALARWARARRVPKVLVAGQGRVIEAVADPEGRLLPSVPVLTVVPHDPDQVWSLLALTLAPPLVASAAARYLGTGLSAGSVKVSARQLAGLPLPADDGAWKRAAELARSVQSERSGAERRDRLEEVAALMTTAYGLDPQGGAGRDVLAWWCARAPR